eukprot:scaffold22408_cov104-Isochrysis_galbana.AAC.2
MVLTSKRVGEEAVGVGAAWASAAAGKARRKQASGMMRCPPPARPPPCWPAVLVLGWLGTWGGRTLAKR